MGRLLSILLLAFVSSCSTLCHNTTSEPKRTNNIPTYKLLARPELHHYDFIKDGNKYIIVKDDLMLLTSDMASLVDLINRYELLLTEHNANALKNNNEVSKEKPLDKNK